jgi:hypothetical protein
MLNALDLAGYWQIDPYNWKEQLSCWTNYSNGDEFDSGFVFASAESLKIVDEEEISCWVESMYGLWHGQDDSDIPYLTLHQMAQVYHQRNYSTDRVIVWDMLILLHFITHFLPHREVIQKQYAEYYECITNGCEKPLFYALLYAHNQCPGGFIILYHCKTKQFLVLDQERETRNNRHYQHAVVCFGLLLENFAKETFSFSGSLQKHVEIEVETLRMRILDSVQTDESIEFFVDSTSFWNAKSHSVFENMLPFYALYHIY